MDPCYISIIKHICLPIVPYHNIYYNVHVAHYVYLHTCNENVFVLVDLSSITAPVPETVTESNHYSANHFSPEI